MITELLLKYIACVLTVYVKHFSSDEPDAVQPISSLPGVNRYGVNKLVEALTPVVQNGLSSVSNGDAVQFKQKCHPSFMYFYCILPIIFFFFFLCTDS